MSYYYAGDMPGSYMREVFLLYAVFILRLSIIVALYKISFSAFEIFNEIKTLWPK